MIDNDKIVSQLFRLSLDENIYHTFDYEIGVWLRCCPSEVTKRFMTVLDAAVGTGDDAEVPGLGRREYHVRVVIKRIGGKARAVRIDEVTYVIRKECYRA